MQETKREGEGGFVGFNRNFELYRQLSKIDIDNQFIRVSKVINFIFLLKSFPSYKAISFMPLI